jgi:hypothetical protein
MRVETFVDGGRTTRTSTSVRETVFCQARGGVVSGIASRRVASSETREAATDLRDSAPQTRARASVPFPDAG